MKTNERRFDLGDTVIIAASGSHGTVVGIARYLDGSEQIQVHYVTGDQTPRTDWLMPALLQGA